MISECIFPVAGLGTRFLPATKETPKEMIPLLEKPVIQYGVEEAAQSGCSRMIMITGRSKGSIENFFDRSWELEKNLESRGKRELLEEVRKVSEIAHMAYARQCQPLGLGHAVLCGEPLCSGEYFGVILPDDVMIGDSPILKQLVDVHSRYGGSVLALEEVDPDQVSRYGIVNGVPDGEGLYSLTDIVEKPAQKDAPSNLAVMGRYILSRRIFAILRDIPRGAGGEYQLTDAIKELMKDEPVHGVVYKGERYDCGTLEGWLDSTIRLACTKPDLIHVVENAVKNINR